MKPPADWKPCDDHIWETAPLRVLYTVASYYRCIHCGVVVAWEVTRP